MRVIRVRTSRELANQAADYLATHLAAKPRSAVALPTGSTPIGLYAELVRRARLGNNCLCEARIFNLDEYCKVAAANPKSFSTFMHEHLISPLSLDPTHVRLLDGGAANLAAECAAYEQAIGAFGGIDLCVLGLGENGHIAFNEPHSAWDARTHIAELSLATRERLATEDWGRERIPTRALTLGIQSVLDARHVLLMIAGPRKRAAAAALHRGVEDPAWPVTALLRHRDATVIELSSSVEPP